MYIYDITAIGCKVAMGMIAYHNPNPNLYTIG